MTRSTALARVAASTHTAPSSTSGAARRAYSRRTQRAHTEPATPRVKLTARIPFVAAIIGLVGSGIIATLLLTTGSAADSYRLNDAREVNQRLSDERATLLRQVEKNDSAPELAARARKLGMIPAKDPARLVVAPDGAVTVIGKPTPAMGAPAPLLNEEPPKRQAEQQYGQPYPAAPRQNTTTQPTRPLAPGAEVRAQGERPVPVQVPSQRSGERR